jgi:hypothetical protein
MADMEGTLGVASRISKALMVLFLVFGRLEDISLGG